MNLRLTKSTVLIFTYIFAMFLLPYLSCQLLAKICTSEIDIQVYANLISYLVLVVVSLLFFGSELSKQFKQIVSAKHFIKHIFIGWLLLFISSYIASFLIIFFTQSSDSSSNQQVITDLMAFHPILMGGMTILCAPLVEEVVFRLTVMRGLLKYPWIAILLSSFLFGLIHVISSLFIGDFADCIYIIQYMAMGCALGYVYYCHQNIWYSIGVHAIQNTLSTVMVILLSLLTA